MVDPGGTLKVRVVASDPDRDELKAVADTPSGRFGPPALIPDRHWIFEMDFIAPEEPSAFFIEAGVSDGQEKAVRKMDVAVKGFTELAVSMDGGDSWNSVPVLDLASDYSLPISPVEIQAYFESEYPHVFNLGGGFEKVLGYDWNFATGPRILKGSDSGTHWEAYPLAERLPPGHFMSAFHGASEDPWVTVVGTETYLDRFEQVGESVPSTTEEGKTLATHFKLGWSSLRIFRLNGDTGELEWLESPNPSPDVGRLYLPVGVRVDGPEARRVLLFGASLPVEFFVSGPFGVTMEGEEGFEACPSDAFPKYEGFVWATEDGGKSWFVPGDSVDGELLPASCQGAVPHGGAVLPTIEGGYLVLCGERAVACAGRSCVELAGPDEIQGSLDDLLNPRGIRIMVPKRILPLCVVAEFPAGEVPDADSFLRKFATESDIGSLAGFLGFAIPPQGGMLTSADAHRTFLWTSGYFGTGPTFVSDDGGFSWNRVEALGAVTNVVSAPGTESRLFAWTVPAESGTTFLGLPRPGFAEIKISDDGGTTWSPYFRQAPFGLFGGVIALPDGTLLAGVP